MKLFRAVFIFGLVSAVSPLFFVQFVLNTNDLLIYFDLELKNENNFFPLESILSSRIRQRYQRLAPGKVLSKSDYLEQFKAIENLDEAAKSNNLNWTFDW